MRILNPSARKKLYVSYKTTTKRLRHVSQNAGSAVKQSRWEPYRNRHVPKFDEHHTIPAEEASRYPPPQRSWQEDGHHGGLHCTIMLLMVIVLLTLRRKDSRRARSFRVPLYPFTPHTIRHHMRRPALIQHAIRRTRGHWWGWRF